MEESQRRQNYMEKAIISRESHTERVDINKNRRNGDK